MLFTSIVKSCPTEFKICIDIVQLNDSRRCMLYIITSYKKKKISKKKKKNEIQIKNSIYTKKNSWS